MKGDLDLTESGFIANKKKIKFPMGNRVGVIKDLICGTANPARNEAVSIPEIASPKPDKIWV